MASLGRAFKRACAALGAGCSLSLSRQWTRPHTHTSFNALCLSNNPSSSAPFSPPPSRQVFADVVEEGQKLLSFYHVLELPATLVIDPVTGAPMRLWTGFIQPDRCGRHSGLRRGAAGAAAAAAV